ncbi:PorH family porin [Corynebacterium mayonis]|uniref:PorH family porin n=1 Tax=Corynebacterium mayonis TaxID=3062461 RepID=UPI003140BD43
MDFATIATQLGDFGKFAGAFVDFMQNIAKAVQTIAGWTAADNKTVENTTNIFGGGSSSAAGK